MSNGTRGGLHTSADPRLHATVNFGDGTFHLYPTGGSSPTGMETTSLAQTIGRTAVLGSLGGPNR